MSTSLCDTEQSFLEDICTHPDDDGLRLIYADWLEEHGREQRAHYIRVQIELARLGEGVEFEQARTADLVRQQTELLTPENFWEWFGPFLKEAWPESPGLELYRGEFAQVGYWSDPDGLMGWSLDLRCGFLDGIEWRRPDLRRYGKSLVRCQPVRTVRLRNAEPWENTVFGSSCWVWECCECSEGVSAEGWNCLLWHHLPRKLFHCLHGECLENRAMPLRGYTSKTKAEQDLSNACLRWCRLEDQYR